MMKKIIYLLFCISYMNAETNQGFQHKIETNRFAREVVNFINSKYNLSLNCFVGELFGQINGMHFEFSTKREANFDIARSEIINIADYILEKINSDSKIKPFLKAYPFSEKEINIYIEYLNNPKDESFFTVVLIDGRLVYFNFDRTKVLLRENFEEAKSIVLKSSPQR